jgi:Domain of unknown function (DUF4386)
MTRHRPLPPPIAVARLGGAMYLIIIALGIFAEVFVRGRLIVANDAVATATNIRAHELLWRWSAAGELISLICVTVLMLTWLAVLRPVSHDLTLLALFFGLTAHAAGVVSALDVLGAVFPLGDAPYLRAFSPEQLAALARLATRQQAHAFGIGLLLSGCFFLVAGNLIFRSGYLPRLIGVLYMIAGVGYIGHTFVLVLAPAFAGRVFAIVAVPIFIGEASLSLYLLIKGVDVAGGNRRQLELAHVESA